MNTDETQNLENWLKTLNREFRKQDIAVRQRPFLALMRYSQDFNVQGISFGSDTANAISDWFEVNTKPEAHQIGSLFTGVFYYDTCFWPIDIEIVVGSFRLEGFSALQNMPESVKTELMATPSHSWGYVIAWANCLDYAYGFSDLSKTLEAESSFGLSLLKSGNDKLRSAAAQLLETRPNSDAAMSCRMATEIFLKAFLVLKAELTEKEVIAFNHFLERSLAKVRELYPDHELLEIESEISVFPKIKDRYAGKDIPFCNLWKAYCIALNVASVVVRSFTDRNALENLLEQNRVVPEPDTLAEMVDTF